MAAIPVRRVSSIERSRDTTERRGADERGPLATACKSPPPAEAPRANRG